MTITAQELDEQMLARAVDVEDMDAPLPEPEAPVEEPQEEPEPDPVSYEELLESRDEAVRSRDGILRDLQGERRRTQQAIAAAEIYQKQLEDYQQQVNSYYQNQVPAEPEPEPLPDPEKDAFGHLTGLIKREVGQVRQDNQNIQQRMDYQDQVRAQEQHASQEEQQRQAEYNQAVQVVQGMVQAEQAFRETNPDYDQALSYLVDSMSSELRTAYPHLPKESADKMTLDHLANSGAKFFAAGQDPALTAYNLAKSRGYKAGENATQNGTEAPRVASPPPAPVQDRFQRHNENRRRSNSLRSRGGPVAPKLPSAREIANLPPDEFQAQFSDAEALDAYMKKQGMLHEI